MFSRPRSRGKPDKAGVLKFTKTQVIAKSELMSSSSAFELFTSLCQHSAPRVAIQNCPRQHHGNGGRGGEKHAIEETESLTVPRLCFLCLLLFSKGHLRCRRMELENCPN